MKSLLLLSFLVALVVAGPLPCGMVHDGHDQAEDIDVQASIQAIAAHWYSFQADAEADRVLRYEWAVVSQEKYTEAMQVGVCRQTPGFDGVPDVLDWTNTGTYTFATQAVDLEHGKTYYVVVRATTARGEQVYANTDGVTIDVDHVPEAVLRAREQLKQETAREKRAHLLNPIGNCPIDDANRCRQSQKSVGEFLREKYGAPLFVRRTREAFLTNGDDEDDDSSSSDSSSGGGLPIGAVIGIALGVAGLLLLLVAGVVLASALVGSKSDKFKTNVRRSDNVEEF